MPPNAFANPSQTPHGLFTYITNSATLFARWIEEHPLPDGLKMPPHVGSYDGKGDPDNFLHLFKGAIRMQKWAMPKDGESTRDFVTRYTDETLYILGLHEEQLISRFVHGMRTRNLVDFLSTDLPTTYKGLMERTYTWIEAKEVVTNGIPSNQ
ncbi:hypothetical protein Tco_1334156 [Tanacetum coccineum]